MDKTVLKCGDIYAQLLYKLYEFDKRNTVLKEKIALKYHVERSKILYYLLY